MTYEENVRRIAEVLARIESPHFFQLLNNYQRAVNVDQAAVKLIDEQEEAARAMIREIYSGIKEYIITCSAIPNVADKAYTAAQYLIERGLIPAPVDAVINSYADKAAKRAIPRNGKTTEQIIKEGSIPDPECQHPKQIDYYMSGNMFCLKCKKVIYPSSNE